MYGQERDEVLRLSADLRERSANARARAARTMARSRWLVTQSSFARRAMGFREARQQPDPAKGASPGGAD